MNNTLKRDVQGSFKMEGCQMRLGKNGEPIFLPQLQNVASGAWDTRFGSPVPSVAGSVYALSVDRQGNVCVGGAFSVVQRQHSNQRYSAIYNVQTNSWSALGHEHKQWRE